MEKRYIIAAAVTFVILLIWQFYILPQHTPQAPTGTPPGTAAPAEPPASQPPADETPAAPAETPAAQEVLPEVEAVVAESASDVIVETDVFRVVLTNRGGRLLTWTLKEYTGRDGEPLEIAPRYRTADDLLPLSLDLDDADLASRINQALFKVERETLPPGEDGEVRERVRFRWADGRGTEVVKTLDFRERSYVVGADVRVTHQGRTLPVELVWGPGFETRRGNGGLGSYYYSSQALWNIGGQVTRDRKIKEPVVRSGRLYWGGLEDQYFAALIVPLEPGGQAHVWTVDVQPVGEVVPTGKEAEAKEPPRQPAVGVSVPPEGVLVFVGPKNYNLLRGLGHDLRSAVWFSSISLFAWMARLLYEVLIWLHTHVVANYGLAIILATVLLRILLFPLNQFSMVRMKKVQTEMQRIQPKVNAIKNKYRKKKDAEGRAEMNKELMALYKREGINPMGGMSGCLPLVIQFPILIGFYDMLLAAVELRGAPFYGWIRDLTLKDPYYVTPILMGVTMFLQQRMSMTKMGDPAQQRIMMMTPVIFTVMFLNLPSGLVLYWFVNNLLGIGQQWLVNRHIGRLESASQRA